MRRLSSRKRAISCSRVNFGAVGALTAPRARLNFSGRSALSMKIASRSLCSTRWRFCVPRAAAGRTPASARSATAASIKSSASSCACVQAAAKRADNLLAELGLSERANNVPEKLSGGERQRVAIGRALMNDPDLVLVDEPTAALDTALGRQVVELLAREVKQRGKTGIMVTHDLRMVEYTDEVFEILDGKLTKSTGNAALAVH